MPRVSIITAAYNAERYISETIESVLNQTFTDWELIIINDGSSDATNKIVEKYLTDERITYIYQKNQGPVRTRNNAYKISTGTYIAILDGDDVWMPTKLEKQIKLITKDSKIGLVYTGLYRIDERGKTLKSKRNIDITKFPLKSQICLNRIAFSSFLIRRSAVTGKLLDERFPNTGDGYLTLKIAIAGWKFGFVNEKLLKYRVHNAALSRSLGNNITVYDEKLAMLNELSNVVTKRILSKAYAMANLGVASRYIRYGQRSNMKIARSYIVKSWKYSYSLSVLARAIKWYLLSYYRK